MVHSEKETVAALSSSSRSTATLCKKKTQSLPEGSTSQSSSRDDGCEQRGSSSDTATRSSSDTAISSSSDSREKIGAHTAAAGLLPEAAGQEKQQEQQEEQQQQREKEIQGERSEEETAERGRAAEGQQLVFDELSFETDATVLDALLAEDCCSVNATANEQPLSVSSLVSATETPDAATLFRLNGEADAATITKTVQRAAAGGGGSSAAVRMPPSSYAAAAAGVAAVSTATEARRRSAAVATGDLALATTAAAAACLSRAAGGGIITSSRKRDAAAAVEQLVHEVPPPLLPQLQNVVASAQVAWVAAEDAAAAFIRCGGNSSTGQQRQAAEEGCTQNMRLDLRQLAISCRCVEYNPRKINACIVRLRKPKCTALIFRSGRVMLTGARSEQHIERAARLLGKLLTYAYTGKCDALFTKQTAAAATAAAAAAATGAAATAAATGAAATAAARAAEEGGAAAMSARREAAVAGGEGDPARRRGSGRSAATAGAHATGIVVDASVGCLGEAANLTTAANRGKRRRAGFLEAAQEEEEERSDLAAEEGGEDWKEAAADSNSISMTEKQLSAVVRGKRDSRGLLQQHAEGQIRNPQQVLALKDLKIENVVVSADCGVPVRLEGLAFDHKEFCSYEPELFPGLVYRYNPAEGMKAVLLVFVSGKLVITGCRSFADAVDVFHATYPLLIRYHC